MRLILLTALLFSFTSLAASKKRNNKRKVVYKYKKYEKFDFNDMLIEGDAGSPGDLSVNPRFQRYYKNRLPRKENFNREIISTIDAIN